MKHLYLIGFTLVCTYICATTYQVGSTRIYTSPNALYAANVLQDGDIIEIDAETYIGQATLARWTPNNLTLKGVGGRPHLIADGAYISGKGIWVLVGDNITVENIEFSGATVPDQNGAGIRLDGSGLTVRNCYFHDNETGILTNNTYDGDILIEYTEFDHNGYGDGYSHNLYIGHVNSLTFQYNYSHHAIVGHNLKSRAKENYILYNRIMDEETGNSSRLIDLPNGGYSVVLGNVLMQGENAINNNLLGYGLEGLASTSAPHIIYIINNTFVNKRVASCLFVSIDNGTTTSTIGNNIFAGTGTISQSPVSTNIINNWGDSTISNLMFEDEMNFNYHLLENSPVINAGADLGEFYTPEFQYVHPTNYENRTIQGGYIDPGAFEYQSLGISDLEIENIHWLYPNPTQAIVNISNLQEDISLIKVYNTLGELVKTSNNSTMIDLSKVPNGVYFVTIETQLGNQINTRIIKK